MCAGRPLHEGVDRNFACIVVDRGDLVALFTRAWIETRHEGANSMASCGRPLHEGVDRNQRREKLSNQEMAVALFTRAWIETALVSCRQPEPARRPLHEGVDRNTSSSSERA